MSARVRYSEGAGFAALMAFTKDLGPARLVDEEDGVIVLKVEIPGNAFVVRPGDWVERGDDGRFRKVDEP